MRRFSLVVLVIAAFSACHPPQWTTPVRAPFTEDPLEPSRPREASSPRIPAVPAAPFGSVAARLERFERATLVELKSLAGTIRVERRGREVVSSDGQRGSVITIGSATTGGVAIGDRLYRGSILILPHAQGGLSVINHVPMEDYVRGVVASELAIWSASPALLESQAIAARSYAEAQLRGRPGKHSRTFLSDSTLDQAYAGEYQPGKSEGAQKVAARLRRAVETTRDILLVVNGRVLDARFHASCGGRTASFESVFDEIDPGGMTPVRCDACAKSAADDSTGSTPASANVTWKWTAEPEQLNSLARQLGLGTRLRSLFPVRRDNTGRWLEVRLVGDRTGHNLDTTELRRLLGFNNLKSTWIIGTRPAPGNPINGSLTFAGRGRGHGVGFCQTGARELSERGLSAPQILKTYFPTATLSRVSSRSALLPASDS